MADLEVKGLSELKAKLDNIPNRLVKNVLRAGLRQAANVIKDQAKANFNGAPGPKALTGALKASIRVSPRKGTPTSVSVNVVAGELTKSQVKKFGQKSAFYAVMVEKGHWINHGKALSGANKREQRNRRIAAGEKQFVPPHPFMRPALESKAEAAISVMIDVVTSRLEEDTK